MMPLMNSYLVKHVVDHVWVGYLVEQLGSLKSSQPLTGLLSSSRHSHIEVEQDGQEVLGIAEDQKGGYDESKNEIENHLAITIRFSTLSRFPDIKCRRPVKISSLT